MTRHNGRAGKHGVYNPKHNDRQFDLTNADHIDAVRERQNIYWDCFQGFRTGMDDGQAHDSFEDVERLCLCRNHEHAKVPSPGSNRQPPLLPDPDRDHEA